MLTVNIDGCIFLDQWQAALFIGPLIFFIAFMFFYNKVETWWKKILPNKFYITVEMESENDFVTMASIFLILTNIFQ